MSALSVAAGGIRQICPSAAAKAPTSAGPAAPDHPATEPISQAATPQSAPPPDAPPAEPPLQTEPIEPAQPASLSKPELEVPPTEAPPPSEPTAPVPSTTVVDPGGVVAIAAPKPGPEPIGPAKCKLCHKLQHASWAETAHAKREPPLDCEGCHGPGSEYQKLSVMKDPAQARAAGLVDPDREFCATCHKSGWSDDMLQRTHDHKT